MCDSARLRSDTGPSVHQRSSDTARQGPYGVCGRWMDPVVVGREAAPHECHALPACLAAASNMRRDTDVAFNDRAMDLLSVVMHL
jgi:hypothetical protein